MSDILFGIRLKMRSEQIKRTSFMYTYIRVLETSSVFVVGYAGTEVKGKKRRSL